MNEPEEHQEQPPERPPIEREGPKEEPGEDWQAVTEETQWQDV